MIAFWSGAAEWMARFTPPPWMYWVFFVICIVLAAESRWVWRFLTRRAEGRPKPPEER